MKMLKFFSIFFCAILISACGRNEQQDAEATAENPPRQKAVESEKFPGQRLQQAGQTLNKAADVEKELAKNAQENERKIEQESK